MKFSSCEMSEWRRKKLVSNGAKRNSRVSSNLSVLSRRNPEFDLQIYVNRFIGIFRIAFAM